MMLDFIEQSNKIPDATELTELFCRSLEPYGYRRFLCLSVDEHLPDFAQRGAGAATHRTGDFIEEYERRGYHVVDPLLKILGCVQRPFMRKELWKLKLNKKQEELMHFREERTGPKVVMVPLRSRDGKPLGMGIGAASPDALDDRNSLAELYAMANQFHLCRDNLLNPEPLMLPDIHLSPREKEMLCWCSQGKSNSVIATILGISEKTVEFHLRSAFRKLDVTSRTTAVLKAVNLCLIAV